MTHSTIVALKRRLHTRQGSPRHWMAAVISALALVSGPAAWGLASTTTTLFTTPNNPSSGAVITMTAQVSSSQFTVAGGSVTFTDTYNGVSEVLGTVQVQSTNGSPGTAILKTEVGGVGNHQFVAAYGGTQVFATSSSTVAAVTFVAPYLTATALTSAGTGPYNLTGTVSAYGPSAPTGSVTFTDTTSSFNLGTVPLNAGTLQTGFAPYQSYPISNINDGHTGGTNAPAVGDFNGDGRLDYAVPTNAGPVIILLGKGDGTFTNGTTINTTSPFEPTSVIVGDFNGDGKQDLAVLSASGAGSVNTYLGNGDGTFQAARNYPVAPSLSASGSRILAEGDFNRDGIQDLVATNSTLNTVAVLLGLGDGSFLAPSYFTVGAAGSPGATPWNVVVGDLNKDGFLDLAMASDGSSSVSILQGNGDGTFKPYITVNTTGSQVGSVAIGDFNNDGVPDLATTSAPNNNVYILINQSTAGAAPSFKTPVSYPIASGPYYLTIGDFNRDGKLDIISADNQTTSVAVLLGNGSGGFGAATYYQVGSGSVFANAADINGDDQIDLTAVTTTGVSVLLSGESESATLNNVSYYGCGSQNIVATYSSDSNYGASTSAPMSVTPAGKQTTALALTIIPVNQVVGQMVTYQATLSPYAYGTQTTNGEIVTFKINGVSFGTAPLSNGVATVVTSPSSTGTYTITASYGGDCGFVASNSTAQNINVLKASTLSWSNPAPITYGTALSATQLNATDSVAGTFAYSPAAGTILPVGTQTLSVTFTPTDPTYGQESTTVQIQVTQEATIITWPTPTPITYGTPLSDFQLDATSSTGVVSVPLSGYFNDHGIYDPGRIYFTGGFDHDGFSYSSTSLSGSVVYNGLTFALGPVNRLDAVYGTGSNPISLPAGHYSNLYFLGAMVNNIAPTQTFTVTYSDSTTTTLTQKMSDWFNAAGWPGEAVVNCAVKRNYADGTQQPDSVCVYGYVIPLDPTKTPVSITLPNNNNILVLSMDLTTPSIPGTFVYNPPAGTIEPVGTDTLSVTFTPTDSADYKPATGTVQLVVTPPVGTIITPTINWPTPANIPYGTLLSATQLNAVAMGAPRPTPQTPTSQLNVLSTSTDGTAFALAGFNNAGLAYSYQKLNNGSVNFQGTTFTLGSPTVPNAISDGSVYTLTTPGNFSTLYLIGAATTTGQTAQPFILTYNDAGNPVTETLDMSSWSQSAGYADETIVATTPYANTQGGGQVFGTYDLYGYTLPVDPSRTLVSVSVPNNRNVVIMALGFGTSTPVVVPGTYTYNPPAGTLLSVGTHTLNVLFTPNNTNGYTNASGSVQIVVTKATPIINWPTPAAVPVGTILSGTQLDATASINGTALPGTFTYTPAAGTVLSTAGTYTLNVLFTPNDQTDYSTATGSVQLVVGTTGSTGIGGGTTFQSSECCFFSQPTPYQITVSGSTAPPTGTVSVFFNGNNLGSGTLVPSGSGATSSASLLLNSEFFIPGTNYVTLSYSGDTNYVPSNQGTAISLRNPWIVADPASVGGGTSTLLVPYAFPVAGTMTFTFNPGGAGITDFTNATGSSTCSSGTAEVAGFVCTLAVTFSPALPGIRREAVQVDFTPSGGGTAEPTLFLYLSGLGDAAQISLGSATQATLTAALNQPQSLAFNPTDKNNATLYVVNSNAGQMDTLPASGGALTQWNAANTRNLQYPTDLQFDAFGNLIVADSTAAKVFEFLPSLAETTIGTGTYTLGVPTASRFDFGNNLYIADAGNTPRILQLTGQTFDPDYYPNVLLSGSSLSYPQSLAVDNSGFNLYVGDGDLNTIQQINLPTGTVSAVALAPCDATVTSCALNSPSGMAFDPNGDMFIVDSGQRVLMVPYNHSVSAPTTQLPMTGLLNPTAITMDGSGNVYVTDLNTNVFKLNVNAGALSVKPLNASVTTKITNTGNLNLSITSLVFGQGGSSSFSQTNTCTSGAVVPGGTCTITVTYSNGSGAATDTLTINSNAFSATGVTIKLSH